jgi:hypothetical protein
MARSRHSPADVFAPLVVWAVVAAVLILVWRTFGARGSSPLAAAPARASLPRREPLAILRSAVRQLSIVDPAAADATPLSNDLTGVGRYLRLMESLGRAAGLYADPED